MTKRSILALGLSGAILWGFAFACVLAVASVETPVQATRALLDAEAKRLVLEVQRAAEGLPQTAAQVAGAEDLANQLRNFNTAVERASAMTRIPPRLQERLEDLRGRLQERMDEHLDGLEHVDGLVLLNDAGTVVAASGVELAAGHTLVSGIVPKVPRKPAQGRGDVDDSEGGEGDGDAGGAGTLDFGDGSAASEAEGNAVKGPFAFLATAYSGEVVVGAALVDGVVRYYGAAPVSARGRVLGVALAQRQVKDLSQSPAAVAALYAGGRPILGLLPEAFGQPPSPAPQFGTFLLKPVGVRANLGGLELAMAPLRLDASVIGIWAQAFVIPGLDGVQGLVAADVSAPFAAMASTQARILFLAAFAWLAHAVLLVWLGRAAAPNRALAAAATAGPAPLANAPSLADVLRAQNMDAPVAPPTGAEADGYTDLRASGVDPQELPLAADQPESSEPLADLPVDAVEALGDAEAEREARVEETTREPTAAQAPPDADPVPVPLADGDEQHGADSAAARPADEAEQLEELLEAEAPVEEVVEAVPAPPPLPMDSQPMEPDTPALDVEDAGMDAAEAEYRRVFDAFVEARESCGEVGALTYDKFRARLVASRDAVVAKHGCKDVQFQVYVKNGKAALKATPL